jgi:tetratricopeptide (TPR) repeat protein
VHGDLKRSVEDYNQAAKLDPKNADIFYRRGIALGMSGEADRAIGDFDQAIKLEPDHVGALYSRGLTYSRTGFKEYTALLSISYVLERCRGYATGSALEARWCAFACWPSDSGQTANRVGGPGSGAAGLSLGYALSDPAVPPLTPPWTVEEAAEGFCIRDAIAGMVACR